MDANVFAVLAMLIRMWVCERRCLCVQCSAVNMSARQPHVPIGGRTSDYAELHLAC